MADGESETAAVEQLDGSWLARFEEGGLRCAGARGGLCWGEPATTCHSVLREKALFSHAIGQDSKFDDNCVLGGGESSSPWNLPQPQPTAPTDVAVIASNTD